MSLSLIRMQHYCMLLYTCLARSLPASSMCRYSCYSHPPTHCFCLHLPPYLFPRPMFVYTGEEACSPA